jgi:hypothetical protein
MAQISDIPFNPSNRSSAIRAKEQVAPVSEPPARETEEVKNEERSQGKSTGSVERSAQQAERATLAKEAETRNDSVRAERQRDQIIDDVIESQEQSPNSPSTLGGLEGSRPSEGSDVSASPTESSRSQNRQEDPATVAEQVRRENPSANVDEIRNDRANDVAQDRLRDFDTRSQEKIGGGSGTEGTEAVTRPREEVKASDEPVFDVPEQNIDQVRNTGPEQVPEPVSDRGQGRENESPARPPDAPTERGLNIDELI